MTHAQMWQQVAGDILFYLAYASPPIFFGMAGFVLNPGTDDVDAAAFFTVVGIVVLVVSHLLTAGVIK